MKVNLLELEMKQKQFEFQHQLELTKLDTYKEAEEARERTEMADLECKLAEREFSCLLFEENPPERHSSNRNIDIDGTFTSVTDAGPQVVLPQAVSTQLKSTARIAHILFCLHAALCTPLGLHHFTRLHPLRLIHESFDLPLHVFACLCSSRHVLAWINVTCALFTCCRVFNHVLSSPFCPSGVLARFHVTHVLYA